MLAATGVHPIVAHVGGSRLRPGNRWRNGRAIQRAGRIADAANASIRRVQTAAVRQVFGVYVYPIRKDNGVCAHGNHLLRRFVRIQRNPGYRKPVEVQGASVNVHQRILGQHSQRVFSRQHRPASGPLRKKRVVRRAQIFLVVPLAVIDFQVVIQPPEHAGHVTCPGGLGQFRPIHPAHLLNT